MLTWSKIINLLVYILIFYLAYISHFIIVDVFTTKSEKYTVICYNRGMIYAALEELGFSKKEADIYVTVLQHGKISVTEVANITKINRTTVYSLVKNLLKRKLIREDTTSKKTYLLARPPEDLHGLLEKEKETIHKKEHTINKAISELQSLAKNVRYSVPKIVFIDEDEIDGFLHKESKKWVESIRQTDGIWWGFQDHTFVEKYESWINWYWNHPSFKQVLLRLLTNESKIEQKMKKQEYANRQMKIWKQDDAFSATVWVNGEYLVMIVTKTRPHYLVEIHDSMLSANMRTLFRELWEKS